MRSPWLTCLAILGITTLFVLPAVGQTSGSGAGSAPSTGTSPGSPGPTNPAPSPGQPAAKPGAPSVGTAPAQPGAPGTPSVGTAPGKAMPGSAQPGTGQMGSGSASTGATKSTAPMDQASSEQVRNAQQALQSKGMDPGPVDGVVGPRTQAALRAYQKDQNLPQTGQLDVQTLGKLGVSK
jgi:hypothetical protein